MKKIDVVQPCAMGSPFAQGVYSATSTSDFEIPAETSTAEDDTCVIDDGFLPITSTDLDDGGIAPERKNFNGLFYLSTDQRFYLQNGGIITYNANVATEIGGYPQDAILDYITTDNQYIKVRSLIDDNTYNFTLDETLIDGEHWEKIDMGGSGTGYQMFDIVMKDHVLTFDETKGFAPLGTYVYKEAIAGTRYGYPDFYAKCVEEYTDSDTTTQYISLRSDITEVGTVTNNNGIASGFSSSNYYYTDYVPSFTNSIKITIPFTLQSLPTANSALLGNHTANAKCSQILLSTNSLYANTSNGSSWITGNQISIENVSWETNVNYIAEYSITSKRNIALKLYKNGVLQGTASVTVSADAGWTTGFEIGYDVNQSPFASGSIDLNGFSIDRDGVRTWIGTHNYKEADNKHRFYDIGNKAYFDNVYGITGEAWYYGVDTTNERIFLPRSTRFKNGTSVDVGQYQEAGLPNITGKFYPEARDDHSWANGAFETIRRSSGYYSTVNSGINNAFSFDASRSSSIYGNSTTVEYSSTKLIPYMCVGNQSDWAGMTDVVNQGMTILEQVNAGLATKLDLDLTNITNATKSAIASYAMPSGTYVDLTLGASGTEYTAPANGWFYLQKIAGSDFYYVNIMNLTKGFIDYREAYRTAPCSSMLPVSKNDVVRVDYNATGATNAFRFYYAVGSESEAN